MFKFFPATKLHQEEGYIDMTTCAHVSHQSNLLHAGVIGFDPPLDEGIREIVMTLIANNVEAFESCEGGVGHSFSEPTVRFLGSSAEGLRALSVVIDHGFPVRALSRSWSIVDKMVDGPFWEMRFWPPKDSPQWDARDTSERYEAQKNARDVRSRAQEKSE
jgi:hypothetical protein